MTTKTAKTTKTKPERVDCFGFGLTYHHIGEYTESAHGRYYKSGGYSSSADTLDEAHDKLTEMFQYYVDLDCQVTAAQVTRFCSECDGTGSVIGRKIGRIIKMKKCPVCRGKDSEVTIEVWVKLPKALWK